VSSEGQSAPAVIPTDLTCEYNSRPLGIDTPHPRLSWRIPANRRCQKQTAYHVLVASSREKLAADAGDLWDSGRVASSQSTHVQYAGAPLASRQQCFWKVRVWDADGNGGPWSQPATFEMGLLRPTDWLAKWIGRSGESLDPEPAPLLRKAFELNQPVRSARAYVCGVGYYELYLNGRKVGDHVLDPGYTRYDRRCLYVTYDVTSQLKQGANAVGAILGNGWYNQHATDVWDFHKAPWRGRPALLLQIHVEFADGSSQVIVSDGSWKVSSGPIVFDGIRNGESYDARLEKSGWDSPGYDDGDWAPAAEVAGPRGQLTAQFSPPMRVTKTITPVSVKQVEGGDWVFDMGQNMAGWAQLLVSGPAGTKITLRYGETLDENGKVDTERLAVFAKSGEFQTDTYILKGQGQEIWEPRFVYHGFQFVQVSGFPGTPTVDNLRGRVVHTSFERCGAFACSNELLNKVHNNTVWSYIGNFHSIPTDCPHREKNGWTGDAQIAAEQGLLNFASASAYAKWMNDLKDEQRDTGELPGIVPSAGWGYAWGNGPAWDAAYILIPWYVYLYCGDLRILEEHYDRMKRYVDYVGTRARKQIAHFGLGDWCPPFGDAGDYPVSAAFTSTGYYHTFALTMARVAELLGRKDDARTYGELAAKIRSVFNGQYFNADTGLYSGGTQTAQSTALYHGLVEKKHQKKVLRQLLAEIRQHGGRINCGILGTKALFNVLSEHGRPDVAYDIATKTTYPGYGYWIEQGATTLWENWDGRSSHNHIMFGDISAWFYKTIAGICPDPAAPGFRNIIIRPRPVGDLTWARGEHVCLYGLIRSAWWKDAGSFRLEVVIPGNCTATVHIPHKDPAAITEGGRPAAEAEGVKLLKKSAGESIFTVESGEYRFECPMG